MACKLTSLFGELPPYLRVSKGMESRTTRPEKIENSQKPASRQVQGGKPISKSILVTRYLVGNTQTRKGGSKNNLPNDHKRKTRLTDAKEDQKRELPNWQKVCLCAEGGGLRAPLKKRFSPKRLSIRLFGRVTQQVVGGELPHCPKGVAGKGVRTNDSKR